jgi:hypothetical protein
MASSCLHQCVSDFKDVFTSDGEVLFCQACGKSVVTQQRSKGTQHLSGSKHFATVVHLKDHPHKQSLIGESSATSSSSGPYKFATSVQSICVHKHTTFQNNNPVISNFLLKYTQTDPPNESTLRNNFLPKCYKEALNRI